MEKLETPRKLFPSSPNPNNNNNNNNYDYYDFGSIIMIFFHNYATIEETHFLSGYRLSSVPRFSPVTEHW